MGNSLQDQLLRAGVASKKQAVRAKKAKNTKEKQIRKGAEHVDETAQLVEKAEAEKRAKDQALNQKRNAEAQSKAIKAQIIELIKLNRIDERGETEFRFNDSGKIKTLMLQNETREQLIKGKLNIVCVNQQYDIVPHSVATKIAERDEQAVVLANQHTETEESDDEYADFKVPDDLMW